MARFRELSLTGKYTANRDGGLTYTYEGSWFVVEDRIVWRARVRRDGQLKGAPYGEIVAEEPIGEEHARDAVREAITTAIEHLAQVEK
jgi:hypothetical protein